MLNFFQEVSRLKSTIASKQTSFDNELQEYKLKAQQEEAHRRKELDDRNRMLQASNSDYKVESEKLNGKIAEQQQKIATLTLENENFKRNHDIIKIVCFSGLLVEFPAFFFLQF
jgi:hypothetical protein